MGNCSAAASAFPSVLSRVHVVFVSECGHGRGRGPTLLPLPSVFIQCPGSGARAIRSPAVLRTFQHLIPFIPAFALRAFCFLFFTWLSFTLGVAGRRRRTSLASSSSTSFTAKATSQASRAANGRKSLLNNFLSIFISRERK